MLIRVNLYSNPLYFVLNSLLSKILALNFSATSFGMFELIEEIIHILPFIPFISILSSKENILLVLIYIPEKKLNIISFKDKVIAVEINVISVRKFFK